MSVIMSVSVSQFGGAGCYLVKAAKPIYVSAAFVIGYLYHSFSVFIY